MKKTLRIVGSIILIPIVVIEAIAGMSLILSYPSLLSWIIFLGGPIAVKQFKKEWNWLVSLAVGWSLATILSIAIPLSQL